MSLSWGIVAKELSLYANSKKILFGLFNNNELTKQKKEIVFRILPIVNAADDKIKKFEKYNFLPTCKVESILISAFTQNFILSKIMGSKDVGDLGKTLIKALAETARNMAHISNKNINLPELIKNITSISSYLWDNIDKKSLLNKNQEGEVLLSTMFTIHGMLFSLMRTAHISYDNNSKYEIITLDDGELLLAYSEVPYNSNLGSKTRQDEVGSSYSVVYDFMAPKEPKSLYISVYGKIIRDVIYDCICVRTILSYCRFKEIELYQPELSYKNQTLLQKVPEEISTQFKRALLFNLIDKYINQPGGMTRELYEYNLLCYKIVGFFGKTRVLPRAYLEDFNRISLEYINRK